MAHNKTSARVLTWGTIPRTVPSILQDLPVICAGLALFYALLSMTHYWLTPANAQTEIQLGVSALPKYAMFSVLRIAIAYVFSFAFTLVYGYIAAYNARAEKFMIPLLDTLQSIPVLSFLPGVMLAMVALFPTRQLGVELGSILLIFTGQVWNMTFSFYSSLKSIPREMREVAEIYRWSWWQRFTQMELPYSAIGLVWNSMMSVAGGWFFLMACEMFVLGNRDLRLPGLGSYLQTAANAGDMRAIVWGLGVMIGIIVLIDQLIWRPVIAWTEKFKFEQVESVEAPHSFVLDLLKRSRVLPFLARVSVIPAREYLSLYFAKKQAASAAKQGDRLYRQVGVTVDFGRHVGRSGLCISEDEHVTGWTYEGRSARNFCRSGRHIPASYVHSGACRAVDDSCRSDRRAETKTFGDCAADRAGCCIRSGHSPIPHYSSNAN